MRLSLFIICLAVAFTATTVWYQGTRHLCPIPLGYHIGTLDESFGISEAEAYEAIRKASGLWQGISERELFYESPDGELVVNFVFDERQAEADSEVQVRLQLERDRERNESLFRDIEKLQSEYDAKVASHEARIRAYEAALALYNDRVQSANNSGGVGGQSFAELERERIRLQREQQQINVVSETLNSEAQQINQSIERANALVGTYNEAVERFNQEFGFSREFTQGDYQNGVINIYKFSSQSELQKVLAHELGHALGIEHVEDESALMYYLLGDTINPPTLKQADIEAFLAVCGQQDDILQRVRRLIRELL